MHPDRRPWTQKELDTLDKLLGKVSAGTIAKRLKRTETSVVMKIKALGHSRGVSEGYTIRDLDPARGDWQRIVRPASLLPVRPPLSTCHSPLSTVLSGWLRDRLQGTQRHDGNGHDIHRFRENNIIAFIKQRPAEINLGKVDGLWFLDLLLMKGAEAT